LVNTVDLFATIAEVSGFQNWRNFIPVGNIMDSKSLLPIIKDENDTVRTWIFTEQFRDPVTSGDGKTIRNDDYHLIRFDDGSEEFYDQTSDPFETSNLLPGPLSATANYNYTLLCDSLHALVNSQKCIYLSVNPTLAANPVSLYPNPTTGLVYINDPQNSISEIELYNSLGQVVLKSHSAKIDVSDFLPGIYFLKITTRDDKIILVEIIKQ
jgi:hypothetical protein